MLSPQTPKSRHWRQDGLFAQDFYTGFLSMHWVWLDVDPTSAPAKHLLPTTCCRSQWTGQSHASWSIFQKSRCVRSFMRASVLCQACKPDASHAIKLRLVAHLAIQVCRCEVGMLAITTRSMMQLAEVCSGAQQTHSAVDSQHRSMHLHLTQPDTRCLWC